MSLKYIKEYEEYSTDFYLDFNKNWFPSKLTFNTDLGKLTYEQIELIPSSNKISVNYQKNEKDNKNPYGGNMADKMRMDVEITYYSTEKSQQDVKIQVTISGGSRDWVNFIYEHGEVYHISETNVKLNKSSWNKVMNVVKKLYNIK